MAYWKVGFYMGWSGGGHYDLYALLSVGYDSGISVRVVHVRTCVGMHAPVDCKVEDDGEGR